MEEDPASSNLLSTAAHENEAACSVCGRLTGGCCAIMVREPRNKPIEPIIITSAVGLDLALFSCGDKPLITKPGMTQEHSELYNSLDDINKAFEEIEEITADLEMEDKIDDWALGIARSLRKPLNS